MEEGDREEKSIFLISRHKVAVRLKKGVRKVTVSGKACLSVDKREKD